MKRNFITLFILLPCLCMIFSSCFKQINRPTDINLIPLYGRVKKPEGVLEADSIFLMEMDAINPDRSVTSYDMVCNGWNYFFEGDCKMAMRRANQAWLLDSTQVEPYILFIVLLEVDQKTEEAIKMVDLTFDVIRARKSPEEPEEEYKSNGYYYENIVRNLCASYEDTHNPQLITYLYTRINQSEDISAEDRDWCINFIKQNAPAIMQPIL